MPASLSFAPRRELGRTGFQATAIGAGDLADRALPLETRVATFGISGHHPEVLRAALLSERSDVLMFPVGPFVDARYVDEILPQAKARGVGTVCFKTFGAGKLLGDTAGYGRPLEDRPRGKLSSRGKVAEGVPELPHLTVEECVRYTLTCDPDVALLGMSFPNEQNAALEAAQNFQPFSAAELESVRRRAAEAMLGKGRTWWNPE